MNDINNSHPYRKVNLQTIIEVVVEISASLVALIYLPKMLIAFRGGTSEEQYFELFIISTTFIVYLASLIYRSKKRKNLQKDPQYIRKRGDPRDEMFYFAFAGIFTLFLSSFLLNVIPKGLIPEFNLQNDAKYLEFIFFTATIFVGFCALITLIVWKIMMYPLQLLLRRKNRKSDLILLAIIATLTILVVSINLISKNNALTVHSAIPQEISVLYENLYPKISPLITLLLGSPVYLFGKILFSSYKNRTIFS